jgi:hypothetical protein
VYCKNPRRFLRPSYWVVWRENHSGERPNKNNEKARIYKGEADGDTIYVFETPGDAAPFADYLHLYLLDGIAVGLKEPL